MAWYRALRNARIGKVRHLKGSVVELEPAALTGKTDNFEPCSAPAEKQVAVKDTPKPAKKEPKKAADAAVSAPSDAPAAEPALHTPSFTGFKKY